MLLLSASVERFNVSRTQDLKKSYIKKIKLKKRTVDMLHVTGDRRSAPATPGLLNITAQAGSITLLRLVHTYNRQLVDDGPCFVITNESKFENESGWCLESNLVELVFRVYISSTQNFVFYTIELIEKSNQRH